MTLRRWDEIIMTLRHDDTLRRWDEIIMTLRRCWDEITMTLKTFG